MEDVLTVVDKARCGGWINCHISEPNEWPEGEISKVRKT